MLEGPFRALVSVAPSPDGRTVAASAYGREINLWDTRTGKEQAPLLVPGGLSLPIEPSSDALLFAPGGKALATAGHDGSITVYPFPSTKASTRFLGHSRPVQCLAFSPDGQTIASADDGGAVKLWNTSSRPGPLPFPPGPLVFARDGATCIAAQENPRRVQWWDVATGRECSDKKGFDPGMTIFGFGDFLAISPNDELLAGVAYKATVAAGLIVTIRRHGGPSATQVRSPRILPA